METCTLDFTAQQVVQELARITHTDEETVAGLYVEAIASLRQEARIHSYIPLLAEKRVRQMLCAKQLPQTSPLLQPQPIDVTS